MYNSFNEKSLRVINNIYNNLLSHPLFSNCQIERINDFGNGTVQLDMYLNGNFYNKYMFCPDPAGNIESVAIYGASLMEHLRKIEASMKFCDIDVLEVSIDNGGYSPYVDVAGIIMLFIPSGAVFALSIVISLPLTIITLVDGHYTWLCILILGIVISLVKRG